MKQSSLKFPRVSETVAVVQLYEEFGGGSSEPQSRCNEINTYSLTNNYAKKICK
jgi:hypothetical protein